MNPVRLRPRARQDLVERTRHYATLATEHLATRFLDAVHESLGRLEQMPSLGSPRIGERCDIPELRAWPVPGFPARWFYLERTDHFDVIRLLGDTQDLLTILGE